MSGRRGTIGLRGVRRHSRPVLSVSQYPPMAWVWKMGDGDVREYAF